VTSQQQIVLVRHGATEWSIAGRHTSRTDVPLTGEGRRAAESLRVPLGAWMFVRVLTSPLQRAADTCRLAGFGNVAEVRDDLKEWDYGTYEGRTRADIRTERPDWVLWRDGAPGGESPSAIGARTDRVLAEVRATDGDVLVFAHGHVLRVLSARWLGLPPGDGQFFGLDTGTLSVLGYEHDDSVIRRWNAPA
jgi:broad specificity phosphatase PhoE